MKTNAETIFDLGIPRLRETLAVAQKALGVATSRGVSDEDAKAVLCAIAHAADPIRAIGRKSGFYTGLASILS